MICYTIGWHQLKSLTPHVSVTATQYSREKPFLASIKERYSLCLPPSQKETYHLVLDISGSGIYYQVGDSVAIAPQNDQALVKRTLQAMRATGEELVTDPRCHDTLPLKIFLTSHASITDVNRKLLKLLLERQSHPAKRELLENIHSPHERDSFKTYLETHEVWDLLEEHSEVIIDPQEWPQLLLPLLPRFYSIASSQYTHPNQIHLTVALLHYHARDEQRRGVCSHFLWHHAPLNTPVIPIYIQPHKGFTLPAEKEAAVIMIGPGTGIAPFRAFMQERYARGDSGRSWLFFGEWQRKHHFFYQTFWEELVKQGRLELEVAFSRDQSNKIYVQHRLEARKQEIFQWIKEGAYLYVCGDAHQMARDVEATLIQIISECGEMAETQAKEYLKSLRHQKRYLKDVY